MKYLKIYESFRSFSVSSRNIFYGDELEKSTKEIVDRFLVDWKYKLGDYVTTTRIPTLWKYAGYDEETICIVSVVNLDKQMYVVVPIEATNSKFEDWMKEDELTPAPEEKVAALKYNV